MSGDVRMVKPRYEPSKPTLTYDGQGSERPAITKALEDFERKERGIPQAHMAAQLVAELRAALSQAGQEESVYQLCGLDGQWRNISRSLFEELYTSGATGNLRTRYAARPAPVLATVASDLGDCGVMPLIDDYAKAVHDGDDALCTVLRRTIEASVAQTAPAVPAGWQLVPVDPTKEMSWAATVLADSQWCYHVGRDDVKKP